MLNQSQWGINSLYLIHNKDLRAVSCNGAAPGDQHCLWGCRPDEGNPMSIDLQVERCLDVAANSGLNLACEF